MKNPFGAVVLALGVLSQGAGCASWIRDSSAAATQGALRSAEQEFARMEQNTARDVDAFLQDEEVKATLAGVQDVGTSMSRMATVAEHLPGDVHRTIKRLGVELTHTRQEFGEDLRTAIADLEEVLDRDEREFDSQVAAVFAEVRRERAQAAQDLDAIAARVTTQFTRELGDILIKVLWLVILVMLVLFGSPFAVGVWVGRTLPKRRSSPPSTFKPHPAPLQARD